MKVIGFVVAIGCALATGSVFAQSGADVVKSKGCLNCHAVDTKKVGPAFKDIAAKKPDAAAVAAKLKDGKGHPKVAASDAEIKAALDYVMSLK